VLAALIQRPHHVTQLGRTALKSILPLIGTWYVLMHSATELVFWSASGTAHDSNAGAPAKQPCPAGSQRQRRQARADRQIKGEFERKTLTAAPSPEAPAAPPNVEGALTRPLVCVAGPPCIEPPAGRATHPITIVLIRLCRGGPCGLQSMR
jgi:hypothetical protein